MKKLLFFILLIPSVSFADRLGGLNANSQVLLSTQSSGGGSSSLAVSSNNVVVSSPTSNINFMPPFIVSLQGSTSAQVTLNSSSATLQGVLSANSPLTLTSGAFGVDGASVTLLGPSIDLGSAEATGTLAAGRFPALTGNVTTSAGSLATTIVSVPSTVLVSSFPATGITAGSYTDANVTFNAQGMATAASSNTTPTFSSMTVTGPVTFSSTTVGLLDLTFDAAQAKLPGSNSPYISNSTTEASCSIYFDDTSTQSVTYAGLVTHYDGRPLYADILFTSTATSGTINFGVYTSTQIPNSTTTNYDSATFNTIVTTSVVANANSNALSMATVALSNTTTANGQIVIFKLEREAGLSDTAVGFGRVKKLRIYE